MISYFKNQFFILIIIIHGHSFYADVDHKNIDLGLYLDAIQYNGEEKIGILPYVLEKKSGTYLEIGTGGDPIAQLMKNIPSGYPVEIIASDIDQNVLDSLVVRHPTLKQYMNHDKYPRLYCKQLNAVDMSLISSKSLDGINASSVLHEIISYAGGINGCKSFFQEALRVLKQDGILVYRDPEFVPNAQSMVTLKLKNKTSKLFAHVFLYKFLDGHCSLLAHKNRKFFMYNIQDVIFRCYKKNEQGFSEYSYSKYLQIPSYDIDFSRQYVISLPYGLFRELSRHYLTYLHACNPLVYIKATPNISEDTFFVSYWAHSTKNILKKLLTESSDVLKDEQLTLNQKNYIDSTIEKKCQVLEFGIPLKFTSKQKKMALRNILKEYGFDSSLYIIAVNHEISLLDYRIFGMLYDQIKNLFDSQNNVHCQEDEQHAYWLKREGEEYYFYYYIDELLSQVLLFSLEQHRDALSEINFDRIDVLCPIDLEHNKFLNRWCYSELLKDTLELYDHMDYPIDIFDGKRIVHFKKMPLSQAIVIIEDIVALEPMKYLKLKKVLNDLKLSQGNHA